MTVVFLHAFPLDERMWEPSLPALAGHEVVAPRLYGLGRTMDEWAAAVLASFSGPAVLVGASMGGYCALAAARREPARVAGVVLCGSGPHADTAERRERRATTIALARERGAAAVWEAMGDVLFRAESDPDVVGWARSLALERTADELVTAVEAIRDRPDSTDLYRALGGRKLTIVGDSDPFVGVEDARAFDPDAVVLPRCGHLPSVERPAEVGALLREAIDRWT